MYLLSSIRKQKYGFTLIEILVVITITALLITLGAVSYSNSLQKSRDTKRKSDLQTISQALERYFGKFGKYPDAGTIVPGTIKCNANGDTQDIDWGEEFYCGTYTDPRSLSPDPKHLTFLQTLPKDPLNSQSYNYAPSADRFSYQLNAKLENTKDPDYCVSTGTNCYSGGLSSKLSCEPASGYNYCIKNP